MSGLKTPKRVVVCGVSRNFKEVLVARRVCLPRRDASRWGRGRAVGLVRGSLGLREQSLG